MTPQQPANSKPRPREWGILALGLVALAAFGLRPSIRGIDGAGNYVYIGSLLVDGDLSFANQYAQFERMQNLPIGGAAGPVSPVTGLAANRYGVGSSLLWSPFVAAVHGYLKMRGLPADGTSRPYEWAVAVGTLFWSALGLMLLYGRLRREFGAIGSAAAIAGLVLASPLGFYMYAHGSMSHGASFFAMAGSVLAVERAWRKPSALAMAVAGAMLALVVEIRYQDASWSVVLAIALLLQRRIHHSSFIIHHWIAFAAAGILAFLPQLAAWKILYGSWLAGPLPYLDKTAGTFNFWPAHLMDALVSERGGALAWHPIIAIGLAGLIMALMARARWKAIAVTGLAGFAVQAWLVGCWSVWWAGASFGNRFFISSLPLVAFGIAHAFGLARARKMKCAAAACLLVLIAWNTGLLIQYATQMIPREQPVPWSRVIKQNVVDVPKLLLKKI
ncbi:MAG: glycosyltransferase family 39 protein [Candidatus Sumerlaeia bacterium]